jgi:hypothetical protein
MTARRRFMLDLAEVATLTLFLTGLAVLLMVFAP